MQPSGAISLDDARDPPDPPGFTVDDDDWGAAAASWDPLAGGEAICDLEPLSADRRLDLVEARLSRIEDRMMELSTLIARQFGATLQTALGAETPPVGTSSVHTPLIDPSLFGTPTVEPGLAGGYVAPDARLSPAPASPVRPRPRRDREADEALEAFLDTLSAQTRGRS